MPEEAQTLFVEVAGKENTSSVILRIRDKEDETEIELGDEQISKLENLKVIDVDAKQPTITADELSTIENANAVWITSDTTLSKRHQTALKKVFDACRQCIDREGLACFNGPFAASLGRLKQESVAELTAIAQGTNFVPDSVIQSSYDDTNRKDLLSVLAANPRCVGIGIEKDTAIVLRGRKIRVLGGGSATFCLMANEQMALRIQHVKQATSRRANPYTTIIDLTAWRREAIDRTLAPFPAAEPPVPLVENGTLMIVGGGGMPRGLMDKMVELAGGKEARMVYVPCSESDEVTGPQRMVETWKKMGVASATFIHTKDRNKANSDDEFLEPLKNATGIWFGGGRQWNFSDSYYGTKAHRLMKDVLTRGGVIGGSSAGASIQARYMCRANPVANFDIMANGYERGLGFIGGIAIDQHFTERGRQKDMTQLVQRYPQLLGVGLDEGTAITVQKSIATVSGKGKVHFYNRREPVITGEDDFTALTKGQVYDLALRKIVTAESDTTQETDN